MAQQDIVHRLVRELESEAVPKLIIARHRVSPKYKLLIASACSALGRFGGARASVMFTSGS